MGKLGWKAATMVDDEGCSVEPDRESAASGIQTGTRWNDGEHSSRIREQHSHN